MTVEELTARSGEVTLAGSVWRPEGRMRGLVHQHPGSGPSDRDNDVLFPPIRDALLAQGIAVSSFDKRGVGGSTGSWMDAGIEAQAADLVASLVVVRNAVGPMPTGLFGHSQGGWVVVAAAALAQPDVVITNSGPAVTPLEQETYSTGTQLRGLGWDADAVRVGVATFGAVMELTAEPFASGWPRAQGLPLLEELIEAEVFIPTDAELWSLAGTLLPYDPAPALRRFRAPLLALHGADDPVIPVKRSAEVYRQSVRPDLLDLRILPGGDHRMRRGDAFVPGYLDAITGFVSRRMPAHRAG